MDRDQKNKGTIVTDVSDLTGRNIDFRRDFIDLAVSCGVLQFGKFQLKSGRISPYFFNAGRFSSGASIARLGLCYACALHSANLEFDMLFGPAYKGIPLVSATAMAMANHFQVDLPYAFNRKESKQHGEGGLVVGAPLVGKVFVVDDVITAGTAINESMRLIRKAGARAGGVLIGLDRTERGAGSMSSVRQIEHDWGVKVVSVITLQDILNWVDTTQKFDAHRADLRAYMDRYGVE